MFATNRSDYSLPPLSKLRRDIGGPLVEQRTKHQMKSQVTTTGTFQIYRDYSQSQDWYRSKSREMFPKEITDKLRSWFDAHLQHPYPTEIERRDIMQQTGLRMGLFAD